MKLIKIFSIKNIIIIFSLFFIGIFLFYYLTIKHLLKKQIENISVVNRSSDKAKAIAKKCNINYDNFNDLPKPETPNIKKNDQDTNLDFSGVLNQVWQNFLTSSGTLVQGIQFNTLTTTWNIVIKIENRI